MKQIRSLRALGALTLALSLILALQVTAAQRIRISSMPQVVDPSFVFEQPLPASDPVDMNWFADAAFVGGSQTGKLMSYSPLEAGLWLTRDDLDVVSALTATFPVNGKELPLVDALRQSGCAKVYLMIGVPGDVGSTEEGFVQAYGNLISHIREALPDIQIYLQTLLPFTASWGETYGFDNAVVRWRNERLLQTARSSKVYLVDVASAFFSPSGSLPEHLSTDGLFLTPEGHYIWVEYLRTHTMRT